MTQKTVIELYPETINDDYLSISDYQPILSSFGKVLLQVDDDDYQGDSRVLYHNSEQQLYGLLIFGWGSCSGCDALQACHTIEQIDELINQLRSKIKWLSGTEMLHYFRIHDWEGDYCWHAEETKEFVSKAINILSEEFER